ncbi:delta-VPH [Grimontia hollisae]|uniref:Thermostable hemolysin n=1 Tax=Grimontia hollisae TaxID=673 RepID=A0A377J7G7_GRIHO|nr:thermostable hemolysin [Grimontia hollisae]AMG29554.2 delta-VPH [Grimontia hollisae]STO77381.1 Thermostable hemolysin [Grimontia hollisae]STO98441.1 Thermostable hemolysin [Grimontia hollisae]
MNKAMNGTEFVLVGEHHPLREHVEHYVRERYALAFDATLLVFMPTFACILDSDGALLSVCGFRTADSGPLFLEQYLDSPAETVLSQQFGTVIPRDAVIEFGQLASFSRGVSLTLFAHLSQYLVSCGYQWGIFTATGPLQALMHRFGLQPVTLQRADACRVENAASLWGSYYSFLPHVSAGNLVGGATQLSRLLNQSAAVPGQRRKNGGTHG